MDQHALRDILPLPQVQSPHGAGFVVVRERAFQQLAALAHQRPAALGSDPPAVGIGGIAGVECFDCIFQIRIVRRPVAPAPIRLADVAAELHLAQVYQRVVAVVSLVGHHFTGPSLVDLLTHPFIVGNCTQVLAGLIDGVADCLGVTDNRIAHVHRQDHAAVHVHRVLGFVRQMRRAIFHLGDLRVRIVRVLPVVVRAFFLAFSIKFGQIFPRRRLDAALLCQLREELLILLPVVAADDRTQRRVGFQRGAVHPDGLAFDQIVIGQDLQHIAEHFLVRLEVDQSPRPRDRRMIWRLLVDRVT